MTEHAERFTGRVEDYERYRMRYPPELLALLTARCGLRSSDVIADIGAGTGMLAELFLEQGNPVLAVEPNAGMRAVCEGLRERYSALTVIDASAEETGLRSASVDFVTAGRAFHWFDPVRSLQEFRRILRAGGWLVLAANGRGHGDSEQEMDYERILVDEGVDHRDVRSRYRAHERAVEAFVAGTHVHEELHGEQRLSLEEFLGQTQSYSSVPLPGDAKYDGMQRALRSHFERFSCDGVLRMATVCYVNYGVL